MYRIIATQSNVIVFCFLKNIAKKVQRNTENKRFYKKIARRKNAATPLKIAFKGISNNSNSLEF